MAELNFGLLNPPGSQSIGNAFVTGMDQAAAARAQENQNALAQYTLGKAQREEKVQNAMSNAYKDAIGPDGTIDYGKVRSALAAGGAGSSIPKLDEMRRKEELDRLELSTKKLNLSGLPNKQLLDESNLLDKSLLRHKEEVNNIQGLEDIPLYVRNLYADPIAGKYAVKMQSEEDALAKSLKEYAANPNAWKIAHSSPSGLQIIQATMEKPQVVGDKIVNMNPAARTSVGTPIAGAPTIPQTNPAKAQVDLDNAIANNAPPAVIATLQDAVNAPGVTAKLAQDRFKFDKDKFAWEKANPGLSIQQSSTGLIAVNPKTLQTFPVNYGNTGFVSAGAQQGAGIPGQRAPSVMPGGAPVSPGSSLAGTQVQISKPLPESYTKELKGVINTNNAINNLKEGIADFTPSDMVNPSRRAEITQLSKSASLIAKEMFNLGVLNGGDLKILEEVIPNPVAFNKGLVSIETIRRNLNRASGIVNQMNKTLSSVHQQPLYNLESSSTRTTNATPSGAPPIESFRRP